MKDRALWAGVSAPLNERLFQPKVESADRAICRTRNEAVPGFSGNAVLSYTGIYTTAKNCIAAHKFVAPQLVVRAPAPPNIS